MASIFRLSAWRLAPRLAEQRPPNPLETGPLKRYRIIRRAAYQWGKGTFISGQVDPLSRGQQWIALPFLPREMPRDHPYAPPHVSLKAVSSETATGAKWHIIDAKGLSIGRLSAALSVLLQGRHRVGHSTVVIPEDRIIVVNAIHAVFAGHTWDTKVYRFERKSHSQGPYELSAQHAFRRNPAWAINHCVLGMLPKRRFMRNSFFKRLFVYPGAIHPHRGVPQVVVPYRQTFSDDPVTCSLSEKAKSVRAERERQIEILDNVSRLGKEASSEIKSIAELELAEGGFSVMFQRGDAANSEGKQGGEKSSTSSMFGDVYSYGPGRVIPSDIAAAEGMHRQHKQLLGIPVGVNAIESRAEQSELG